MAASVPDAGPGPAGARPLTIAHNWRDPAPLAAVADALQRAGAVVRWRAVGIDAAMKLRADPPDALLLRVAGAALLEREWLARAARATDHPPVPAVVVTDDPQLRFVLPAYDVIEEPADPERVAQSLVTAGRRAQAWRGRHADGLPRVELRGDTLARLSDLVSRRTGLALEHTKGQNLGEVVARRMRAGAFRDVDAYLGWLNRESGNHGELEKLLPGLVVGETAFFRTPAHFAALRQVVIPDLVRRRPQGTLRAWSAGCATGEEAYSLAIALREEVADAGPDRVRVLGTDLDHTALERARRGVYRAKDLRKVPPPLRAAHFVSLGEEVHVDQPVRQLVEFDWFNLSADWRAWSRRFPDPLDVIFCENVIIYFRKDLIPPLLERFAAVLRPGGYLFLGYSETLYGVAHPFEDVTHGDTFFYRRPDPRAAAAPRPPEPRPIAMPVVKRATRLLRRLEPAAEPDPQAAAPVPGAPSSPAPPAPLLARKEAARDRLLAGDYVGAEAAYRAVLGDDPDSRGTRLALAFLALKRDDGPAAAALLDAVAIEYPLDPEVFYFRGLARAHAGDRPGARALLERAIFLEPDFVPAHFQLGELAATEGRVADAARHFRNAADAQRRCPAGAVVSFEGVVREEELAAVCERNADALAHAAEGGAA
jgi:chemotaxis protein methyltransferase CheR